MKYADLFKRAGGSLKFSVVKPLNKKDEEPLTGENESLDLPVEHIFEEIPPQIQPEPIPESTDFEQDEFQEEVGEIVTEEVAEEVAEETPEETDAELTDESLFAVEEITETSAALEAEMQALLDDSVHEGSIPDEIIVPEYIQNEPEEPVGLDEPEEPVGPDEPEELVGADESEEPGEPVEIDESDEPDEELMAEMVAAVENFDMSQIPEAVIETIEDGEIFTEIAAEALGELGEAEEPAPVHEQAGPDEAVVAGFSSQAEMTEMEALLDSLANEGGDDAFQDDLAPEVEDAAEIVSELPRGEVPDADMAEEQVQALLDEVSDDEALSEVSKDDQGEGVAIFEAADEALLDEVEELEDVAGDEAVDGPPEDTGKAPGEAQSEGDGPDEEQMRSIMAEIDELDLESESEALAEAEGGIEIVEQSDDVEMPEEAEDGFSIAGMPDADEIDAVLDEMSDDADDTESLSKSIDEAISATKQTADQLGLETGEEQPEEAPINEDDTRKQNAPDDEIKAEKLDIGVEELGLLDELLDEISGMDDEEDDDGGKDKGADADEDMSGEEEAIRDEVADEVDKIESILVEQMSADDFQLEEASEPVSRETGELAESIDGSNDIPGQEPSVPGLGARIFELLGLEAIGEKIKLFLSGPARINKKLTLALGPTLGWIVFLSSLAIFGILAAIIILQMVLVPLLQPAGK